ncbi:MAG: PQQ-dependent sugar dehydrogenase [Phycisphaeraceae bacterium]
MSRASILLMFCLCPLLQVSTACGQEYPQGPITPTAEVPEEPNWRAETVIEGLERPWGIAWLPNQDAMLITERAGRLRLVVNGELINQPVGGLPPILAHGQGGLMDISLHPDFTNNRWVYLTLSQGTKDANHTVLVRGVLSQDLSQLSQVQNLFEVSQLKKGGQHFGSRLLWLADGSLLMSIGDGGNPPSSVDGKLTRLYALDLDSHFGKTVRLTDEGESAPGNPFTDRPNAFPEVYTYGHRNIQGMDLDPATGVIYVSEHGARGGDELNQLQPGGNYGWPAATYSIEYWGPRISDTATMQGTIEPMIVWTPNLAPSGLCFYTGDRYPNWKGDLFAGGLRMQQIRRIDLEDGQVANETSLKFDQRVRDVRQGPDGFMYVLTDDGNGKLLRIVPTP